MFTLTRSLLVAAAALLPLSPAVAADAVFPQQAVRIVVPYPPGGTADVLARLLAEQLGQQWGQRVVVDHKVGAGGVIGVQAVASAPSTRHDIVLGVTGTLTVADVLHVPYKGGTPSVQALLAGDVSMTFENVPVLQAHVQAGKLKGLAVTGLARSQSVRELPPVPDTLKGYAVTTWFGLFAPAGTPTAAINKIHGGVMQALASEAVRARLAGLGIEPVASSPAELSAHVRAGSQRFGRLIKEAKITAD